jgi:hypothetical protein
MHWPKMLKNVYNPSSGLCISLLLKDRASGTPAVWVVISGKDLRISVHFPQGGQYLKVVFMGLLFSDSTSTKTLLYTSENQY